MGNRFFIIFGCEYTKKAPISIGAFLNDDAHLICCLMGSTIAAGSLTLPHRHAERSRSMVDVGCRHGERSRTMAVGSCAMFRSSASRLACTCAPGLALPKSGNNSTVNHKLL